MYAGWDIAMSCDPPRQGFHNKDGAWLVNWNMPSGAVVSRQGFKFGNGAGADVALAKQMEEKLGLIPVVFSPCESLDFELADVGHVAG